ncbi:MAG: ABC transporter substrate-binding protein [Candidatus Hydrogenedentes bacterium]|nr:ABC transporter substrate-binding protein [Candidatus Hydrogenedentota bacterium]
MLVWVHVAWAQEQPLVAVRLIPHWIPQAQFAGYYVAQDKGFYRAAGLDVTILKGGPQSPALTLVEKGEAEFGTSFLSSALVKRDQGVRLVNIAQTGQRSALLLVARKSSGILSARDLNGRKVGVWLDYRAQPLAFFKKNNVTTEIIPQGSTINMFLRGAIDGISAMSYNEYHLLLNAGLDPEDLTVFSFDQSGLNFPEDGVYCMQATLDNQRDVCERFVKASMEGWQYAFDHPGEAMKIIMQAADEAHTGTNFAHQRWMLEQMGELMRPVGEGHPMGWLNPNDYETAGHELTEQGVIRLAPSLEEFHAPCYR